jgi:hypothetical protein
VISVYQRYMLVMRRQKETDGQNCYIQHAAHLTMLHQRYRLLFSADIVCDVLYTVLYTILCSEMVWSGEECGMLCWFIYYAYI